MRYCIELVHDLGERDAQAALGFLRSLHKLGRWHDKAELFRLTVVEAARMNLPLIIRLLKPQLHFFTGEDHMAKLGRLTPIPFLFLGC